MSQEVANQIALDFNKSASRINIQLGTSFFDVTGNAFIKQVISVGTSDESLDKGDIGTIGWVVLHNLDATNYIIFGSDGTLYPLKLKAGEFCLVRWNAAALHAKANTGACLLEYLAIED